MTCFLKKEWEDYPMQHDEKKGGNPMDHPHKNKQSKIGSGSVGRVTFVGISVLLQVVWIVLGIVRLQRIYAPLSLLIEMSAFILVLALYSNSKNNALKMPWIMLILAFPLLGVSLYFLLGRSGLNHRIKKRYGQIKETLWKNLSGEESFLSEENVQKSTAYGSFYYLQKYEKYPLYKHTKVTFFGQAEEGFLQQIEDMKQAKVFIFLEYHAIEDGESFGKMKAILEQKVKEGVEVRILYDDVGSMGFLTPAFVLRMKKAGVDCRIFNPVIPFLKMFMNHRDHRKITVIDGKVGYTGGYNLAEEYFNKVHPYGHWKDTGIRLEGEAVNSFTALFLELWNVARETDQICSPGFYQKYFPKRQETAKEAEGQGFVQPFGCSPLDGERTGENAYLNLVKAAKSYVHITTPYLMITDEMSKELELAVKRGVEVILVTPGIPDKKLVNRITKSYYHGLAKSGVRIFEYTPGFLHAKEVICDGDMAIIGTINLDYRSLYLHFENGVLLAELEEIQKMEEDFQATLQVSNEVTQKYQTPRRLWVRMWYSIFRLIAPLL